jgi:hypothetical protein
LIGARRDREKASSVSDKCVDQLAYHPLIGFRAQRSQPERNPSANNRNNNRKGNIMKRILYTTAIILSFAGAAAAQTTSSGGQPAGNQPGTNMSNTYHHSNPSDSTMGGESRNDCYGSSGSMGNGSTNPGMTTGIGTADKW